MSNRERLIRAISDLEKISRDDAIGPTPYEHFRTAIREAQKAGSFVLDMNERDVPSRGWVIAS